MEGSGIILFYNLILIQPGEPVPASIPYSSDPVAFYKWWKKAENNNKVTLSKADQIKLFIKVNQLEPKALLVRHKAMIMSK